MHLFTSSYKYLRLHSMYIEYTHFVDSDACEGLAGCNAGRSLKFRSNRDLATLVFRTGKSRTATTGHISQK
jgi:hypothetical protein